MNSITLLLLLFNGWYCGISISSAVATAVYYEIITPMITFSPIGKSGKNHFHEMSGDVGMAGWK